MQEAGQLAGPEALLHFLLEAADEQHLPEEISETLLREGVLRAWLLLDLCHCGLHYADARMGLVEQWRRIQAELAADWADVRLAITVPNPSQRSTAAALLGPTGPGIAGDELRVSVSRTGSGIGPDQLAKLLGKIDEARIRGALRLLETGERAARMDAPRAGLADAWKQAVAALPPDWSDLYCELDLTSSDHLQRAALLVAPLNPARVPGRSAFRFRVAHTYGYGASPQMTARCVERVDQEGIPGQLTILHALSDTHNVDTQGPVWRVGGKAV
jgi:hypothetical protein